VKGKTRRGGTHAHQERNPEQMKADERRGKNGRHTKNTPFTSNKKVVNKKTLIELIDMFYTTLYLETQADRS
jgi:hypothetical protein